MVVPWVKDERAFKLSLVDLPISGTPTSTGIFSPPHFVKIEFLWFVIAIPSSKLSLECISVLYWLGRVDFFSPEPTRLCPVIAGESGGYGLIFSSVTSSSSFWLNALVSEVSLIVSWGTDENGLVRVLGTIIRSIWDSKL